MPYVPPDNEIEYILDDSEESDEIVYVEDENYEDTSTHENYGYTGPNDIGVPDPYSGDDIPPADEITEPLYVVTYTTRLTIGNFEPSYLQELYENGAIFYAIYDDDTEEEVEWDEIEDLNPADTIVDLSEAIASATNQHFWNDSNGVHVAEVNREDWDEAVEDSFSDLSSSKNYYNVLVNSLGMLFRRALYNLVSVGRTAISFYDGTGNNSSNVTAYFGRDSAQIGRSGSKHLTLTSEGITAYNSDGTVAPLNASNITAAEANITNLQTVTADIATIRADSAKIHSLTAEALTAATAYIASLNALSISANDISANKATINSLVSGNVTTDTLRAASAYIAALTTGSVTASDIIADKATLGSLVAGDVSVSTLRAASAYIASLSSANVTASDISANKATINSLVSGNVTTDTLRAASAYIAALTTANISSATITADHANVTTIIADYLTSADIQAEQARVGQLLAGYLETDFSNADVAWIENGTIKDGSITNAMINSVSANKLTAGTIDASNITVTNLNADNITTGTINGQRIGTGSLSLDKLADDVYTETEIDSMLSSMQSEIDGAIETWTGTAVPTLNNAPASGWTTNAIKDTHVGDVYFVVNSQSQQNGYNYRFTKSGSTYSWQLIKDNDVTNALSRLTTAEGKIGTIEQFDSDISSWKTTTDSTISTMQSNHTALAGRVETAEGTLATKVDSSTFNTLSQTVDGNTSSITQLVNTTTSIANKVTLDSPYVEVEWVETNGTQFVMLDWKPGSDWGFAADFIIYNTFSTSAGAINPTTNRNGYGNLFGVRDSSGVNDFQLGTYKTGNEGLIRTGSNSYNPYLKTDKTRQQCSLIGTTYTRPDGTTATLKKGSVSPALNMSIFAMIAGTTYATSYGNYSLFGTARLYSLKFYQGSTVEVDLVGAVRTDDGVTGLYDKIANRFYACPGMTYGDDVAGLGTPKTVVEKLLSSNPVVFDTRLVNSRLWTADAPMIDKLEDGQQITFHTIRSYTTEAKTTELFDKADSGNSSNGYLQLTLSDGSTTSWIPMYYNNTTRLTSHYSGNGTEVHLTYHENVLSGNAYAMPRGWWADANYTDGNTTYSRAAVSVVAGKNGVKRTSLCMKDDEGHWTSIINEANNTAATGKTSYTGGLQLGTILYHSSTTSYVAGANTGELWESYILDFRYSSNGVTNASTTSTLALRQPVYLVGTLGNDGLFYLDSTQWWTQTPSDDTKIYIFVGAAHTDYYEIYLNVQNPAYVLSDGDLVELNVNRIESNSTKINTVSDTVDGHTQLIGAMSETLETKADGSTVSTLSSRVNNISTTVDGYSQQISSITSTVTQASSTASEALQTALDGAFLVLTSTNGQLFKNGAESTILQVAIFPNGGERCDTIAQVRDRFGPTAYIEWQWMHESDGNWGTLVSSDSHISQGGMWLTVTPQDVATKTTFAASLVVPGEEEENGD